MNGEMSSAVLHAGTALAASVCLCVCVCVCLPAQNPENYQWRVRILKLGGGWG